MYGFLYSSIKIYFFIYLLFIEMNLPIQTKIVHKQINKTVKLQKNPVIFIL